MSCVFCELPENRIIEKSSLSKVFRDAFPVTPLHTLIIPIRHVSDYFDLSQEEKADIENLLVKQKKHIMELDENVCGFNIGINIGFNICNNISIGIKTNINISIGIIINIKYQY